VSWERHQSHDHDRWQDQRGEMAAALGLGMANVNILT
jgi:hypothetical protein